MYGAFRSRVGPPRSIRHTETLVFARIRAGSQSLLDGYGEGQGELTDPLSEVGATHLWSAPGNTLQPVQGERRDPIGGGGGGSGTPPTPTQVRRTYTPPRVALQTVVTGAVPRVAVEDPP